MTLSTEELLWALLIAVILGGSLAFVFYKQRKEVGNANKQNAKSNLAAGTSTPLQLQLQAYERLILLSERISLTNLVNRVPAGGLSAKEMQTLLTESIKQEFDHNVTQQIYVSSESWDAVKNLKEQNIFIVNQVASFLPKDATAFDLNKHIIEMIMENPKASLHGVVAEVLSYEAKKVMKS
jgi:hypothetical protein